jgi:hypothetical protein
MSAHVANTKLCSAPCFVIPSPCCCCCGGGGAAKCPKCEHPEAWFHQMQTRSADEASTIFYECGNPKCGFKWNEN